MNRSVADIAWLAGLVEGEGCFLTVTKASTVDGRKYLVHRVQMNMTDEDVLRRAVSVSGLGSVTGPYKQNGKGHKPVWRWNVNKRRHIYGLLVAMYPFMGQRRRARMMDVLRSIKTDSRPFWRHGTRQGYEVHACRCEPCTANNTRRHRLVRARRRTTA